MVFTALGVVTTLGVALSVGLRTQAHSSLVFENAPGPSTSTCTKWDGLPTDVSQLPQLTCGVLVYLHIVKNAGTTITAYLQEVAPVAGFTFHNVQAEPGSTKHFALSNNTDWIAAKQIAYDNAAPKLVVTLHNGVPGVGNELWGKELEPMRTMLKQKGCELRLATTLRHSYSHLVSAYTYLNTFGHVSLTGTHGYCAQECMFAGGHANEQLKYILAGHEDQWPDEYFWDPKISLSSCSNITSVDWNQKRQALAERLYARDPLPRLYGNASYDLNELLPRAIKTLELFSLIGQSEDVDAFCKAINVTLGLQPSLNTIGILNPTVDVTGFNITSPGKQCFVEDTGADHAMYSGYCGSVQDELVATNSFAGRLAESQPMVPVRSP